ncbi:MAG: peptide chain release factor N(5)-glutamine methyltransferase [Nitrospinae bacterium]|nr:peptide chain release factor N(5)-glutamine methyltransferase [Nitrospinota bacterium]
MKSIRDILNWSTEYLEVCHIDDARLDSEILLTYILNKNRTFLYINSDRTILPEEFKRFKEYVERRGRREPLSYITGEKEFWSLKFKVTRDTLIPRPDTEVVVQTVLNIISNFKFQISNSLHILDIGTGCGNIAISIAVECPESYIFALDKSDAILSVARENAITHNVAERISFIQGDLLDLESKNSSSQITNIKLYDIIVSNPPYIPSDDIVGLMPEVKDWEPRSAIDGGKDGLEIIRNIVNYAPLFLKPAPAGLKQGSGGFIAMEIGFGMAKDVRSILLEKGNFYDIRFERDLSGVERVVVAWKK